MATIGAGNLEHRANIKTGDEIEELAVEFNKMTDALQNSYATLEQKVDQRNKEISALYSVTTAVNQSLALKDILDAVIAKTTEIFSFESTRVFLFKREKKKMELRASFEGDLNHQMWYSHVQRGEGIVGQVVETGEPMIFEDIQTDPRYDELSTTKASHRAKLRYSSVFPLKPNLHVWLDTFRRPRFTKTYGR